MRTVPLWTLAAPNRETVDPASLDCEVIHYSIPSLEATGRPALEPSDSIKSLKLRLRGGELLISKLNPRKGRVLIVPRVDGVAVASTEFVALRPHSADPRFLAYCMSAEITRQFLDANVRSVTRSHQRVEPEVVARVPIPKIGIDEQRRIADFLDTEISRLDALAAMRLRQCELVAERASAEIAGLVEDLFERYGSVPMRRMVTSIAQGWSPVCDDAEADPQEWAVLKTSAVSAGTFDPMEHKRLPTGLEPDRRYVVRDGDLLMTRGSGSPDLVGVAAVARAQGRRLLISDLLYRVTPDGSHSPEYLAALLRSRPVRERLGLLFRGQSGQTIKLRSEDVASIPLPALPSKGEGRVLRDVADFENGARQAIDALRRSEQLVREYRRALITAAVTGQFDVTTAHGGAA